MFDITKPNQMKIAVGRRERLDGYKDAKMYVMPQSMSDHQLVKRINYLIPHTASISMEK